MILQYMIAMRLALIFTQDIAVNQRNMFRKFTTESTEIRFVQDMLFGTDIASTPIILTKRHRHLSVNMTTPVFAVLSPM